MRTVAPLSRWRALLSLTFCSSAFLAPNGAGGAENLVATPLAPHSGPRTGTMFVEVTPDASGVHTENRYADPEMWNRHYHEFEIGAMGTGVAIGDYDGDGRPDLFIVSKTESCRLFRNLGDWKFQDVTAAAGVEDRGSAAAIWKGGAAFADVNNDGLLDIYVCRWNAPNLLYINQGNGTFREMAHAYGLDLNDASSMAAFCDYDRDGWLDVYVETNLLSNEEHPNGQRDHLFHNNRDGTFTDVTAQAGISMAETQCHSATWWDFNNDGWPDLYVANDFAQPDCLYRNNGDGTFTNVINAVVPHTPYSSMGADLGDLNNDGRPDLLVADMAASTHMKDQRTMAETRARMKDPSDNATDVPQYPRSAVFLDTGTDRCLEVANLLGIDATDWTWSPRFEDLDNDGWLDLTVTNGMHREIHNADLIQRMMLAETAQERIRIAKASPVLVESHFAFRNRGDLSFENVSAAWGLDRKGVSFGSAFGDLDGDGDLDMVYTNYQAPATLLRNDSDTGHRLIVALRGTVSNRFGVGSTVLIETSHGRQVRQLVLARGYMSTSEPICHFGLGEENEVKRLTVFWPSGHVQTFEHIAGDQRLTITEPTGVPPPKTPPDTGEREPGPTFSDVTAATRLSAESREDPLDELAQQPLLPIRFNRRGPALAVADLTGRGHPDIVIGGTTRTPLRLLVPGADHAYTAVETTGLATSLLDDGPVLAFDADGDGRTDLLVTRGGVALPAGSPEYQPILYRGDGTGHFEPVRDAIPPLPYCVGAVAAADFDRDGRLDVFVGSRVVPGQYPTSPASALLANRGGRFEDVTDTIAPALRNVGLVTGAVWSDVDADGWPDLLVTAEWGAVRYFRNDAGKGFTDRTDAAGFASAGTGWWTGIASADFNGDGRPDFVVGNVGLNTPYHADPKHPALLFAGTFAGEDGIQLVEGYYEGDHLYPWRTRKDLGAQIPYVLKKYPRNDFYARATLPEIIGPDKLARADRYAATELRSGVFLSQPDGTYRFEALPRIAQASPFQGVVAGDFDGDGNADIYAVQNEYAPNPTVGRFDGGLSQLLLGDGHGHFTAVPVATSRLSVSGDAKALVVLDLNDDGWPDFLATRNNSTTIAFANHPQAARHSVRVTLNNGAGNPSGIGASITAVHADGSHATAEIFAGSGAYSQSEPAAFFGWRDGNPIRQLEVRWPDGTRSTHPAPGSVAHLTLTRP